MRVCWNWQTGTFEGRVFHDVRVQVPSLAPRRSKLHLLRFFYFIKNQSPVLLLLLSEKGHAWLRLFACKRTHDAFAALPTFFGFQLFICLRESFFVNAFYTGASFTCSDFFIS